MGSIRNFFVSYSYWIIPLLFLAHVASSVPLDKGFNSDSGLKLLQTRGILSGGARKQEVYYPGQDVDPDYSFNLFKDFLIKSSDGRIFGQYSWLFACISAPILALLGTSALVPFCILLYLLSIFAFERIYKPSKFTVFFALLCTPILLYSLEYSENTLFLLFSALGVSIYFRNPELDLNYSEIFLSGFLIGLPVWLRLEPLIFIPMFGLSILLVRSRELLSPSFWKENIVLALGISLAVGSFLLYNSIMYHNFLGPRFAVSGKNVWDLGNKLKQMFVLFFFGYWKLGYFGYMPLLLWVFISQLGRFNALSLRTKLLVTLNLIYIPSISFLVGTEAFVNWGPRYLALALFPSLMVLDDWYLRSFSSGFSKLRLSVLILLTSVSIWATYKGFQMIRASYKQIGAISKELSDLKPDYLITGSQLISGHFGKLVMDKPCFLISSDGDAKVLADRIFAKEKGKTILFIVSKHEMKDVEEKLESGGSDSLFSLLKKATPHVLAYRNLSAEENQKIVRILKDRSATSEEKEARDYFAYLFRT
ncbi:hypothetical protein EHQ53_11215 [Leptospira langatensis]|uniref:Glycosyltransferase RgtA/B/C/D-like domain-containing protein n=1 Tax=Leptospira langatensis TaxID=2484983 RepID=A0A5F1ZSG7_9LEPT|nr:hypothetical protein [Leptospira langatensis]TGJ98879.1 hypothetical protein EHO57_15285 [Leptospira langatensis]TGL40554.1 hypothetical protein EHQ53_11215 [Leptospira langatensis]